MSNHQGEVSAARAACFAAAGQTCAVVRLSLEDEGKHALARRQIQALQGAGLAVMGYIWCYFSEDAAGTAQQAMDWYGDLGLAFWWLDAEEVDPRWNGDSPQQRGDWLQNALWALGAEDLRAGLYTANWWWGPYMAGSTRFAGYPLWVAEYDDVPDLDRFYPFGGWQSCQGKQFTGTGSLCGVAPLDLNVFADSLFDGAPPQNGDEMDTDRVKTIAAGPILENIDSALAAIDVVLTEPHLLRRIERKLLTARENLEYGAKPAAQTLARGET